MSHQVIIKDAVKRYGDFQALNGINLTINPGEFFTLLGPSGCGKTTLLRMIAGFHSVDGGSISFDQTVMNHVPAHKRDIGMVFQNYAIFPHLTVAENVAYGLKVKRVPRPEIERRVQEALQLVQIESLASRKPNELSGGQQQRVALARAFIIEPSLLLMDEPLSNLDAKLRIQMRAIIKKLQRRLGITTIYVTHDQEEALAISDRIAVMQTGSIMQVDTPKQIYRKPANPFVAGFIGVSNFIPCQVNMVADASGNTADVLFESAYCIRIPLRRPYTGKAIACVRPEQMFFHRNAGLAGKVTLSVFLGDFTEYEIKLETGQTVWLNEYAKDAANMHSDGQPVHVCFPAEDINLYTFDTGEVISC